MPTVIKVIAAASAALLITFKFTSMTESYGTKSPLVGYDKSNLQKNVVQSDFKAESDVGSHNNAIVFDAYASDNSIRKAYERIYSVSFY